jgi:hypothetical protein
MIRWLDERGPVRWLGEPVGLGRFNETTVSACLQNPDNWAACFDICVIAGAAGWNALLAPECQSICLHEACGEGMLITPHGMGKVMKQIGDCLTYCNAQADKLPDDGARQAAKAACPSTCGLYQALADLPPEDKQDAKTAKIPKPPAGSPPPPKKPPPPITTANTASASSGGGAGTALVVVGVLAAVAWAVWGAK